MITAFGRPVPLLTDFATDALLLLFSGGTTVEAIDIERLASSPTGVVAMPVVRVIDPAGIGTSGGYPLGMGAISCGSPETRLFGIVRPLIV